MVLKSQGFILNQLLQTVTHIYDLRKIKYVHVTIDTFSGFLVATALTGEATKNVISHCLC